MNTGSFYVSNQVEGINEHTFAINSHAIERVVEQVSSAACSGNEKLVIHRVAKLSERALKKQLGKSHHADAGGAYVKHVQYLSADDIDFPLSDACSAGQVKYVSAKDAKHAIHDAGVSVVVVDYEDSSDFSLKHSKGLNFIVQERPSFDYPESKLEGLKHYVEDKIHENLNLDVNLDLKREVAGDDASVTEEEEYDKLVAEIEDDFRAAESYVAQEGEDLPVNIYSGTAKPLEDGAQAQAETDFTSASEKKPSSSVKTHSNLFTKYQFFTPGVLLGLIVSFILVAIVYISLTWLTSLEISYKSFEKQVDFEKKNE